MFKQLIIKLFDMWSRPKELYIDKLGFYWVELHYTSIMNHDKIECYPYTYQNIGQTSWGLWELDNTYSGLYNPLPLAPR